MILSRAIFKVMEEYRFGPSYEATFAESADFELEVREFYEEYPGIYQLSIVLNPKTHSRIELVFTLSGLEVLEQMLAYLQVGCLGNRSENVVKLGQCFGRNATLAQDDEWLQRYFLFIRNDTFPGGDYLAITIAGEKVQQLITVLEEIIKELNS